MLYIFFGGLLFEVGALGLSCFEPFPYGVLESSIDARPACSIAIDKVHVWATDPRADDTAYAVPAFIVERWVRQPVSLDELPDGPFFPQEDGFIDDSFFPNIAVDAGTVTAIGRLLDADAHDAVS